MKKFILLLLSLTMFFSLSVPVFAASEPAKEDNTTSFSGETFYYNAETGEMVAENGEPFEFEEIQFELPMSSDSTNTSVPIADPIEIYNIRGGLQKTSGGKFTWWFNVDCPTSPIKKPNIKLTAQVKGNFTNGSSFSNVGSSAYHVYTTNAEYGVNYTWTTTAKTGYYYLSYTLNDFSSGKTKYKSTDPRLFNRTGYVWNFTFNAIGKTLTKPRADWKKGAIHSRPSNLANTYYNTYKSKTGKTLDRSLYDVHHIQPLAYGGNNNYSNLIHLPKSLHTKVTNWFKGY